METKPSRSTFATMSSLRVSTLLLILVASGCVTAPYRFGSSAEYRTSSQLQQITDEQIERGRPNMVVDAVGWVVGIPSKIILWDRRIENHNIGSETEASIAAYLEKNELSTVKVRLNQYRPFDDWRRLVANKSVGAGWRYTIGTLSVAGETLLPGRLLGGDHFNPYTNTIHLYSDVTSVALHEAGHSKDFARRTWKGTYAFAYGLPLVPLYHEAVATNDAISYLASEGNAHDQQEAYEILYPAYSTYLAHELDGGTGFLTVPVVIAGHLVGRVQAMRVPSRLAKQHARNHSRGHDRETATATLENANVVDASRIQD